MKLGIGSRMSVDLCVNISVNMNTTRATHGYYSITISHKERVMKDIRIQMIKKHICI